MNPLRLCLLLTLAALPCYAADQDAASTPAGARNLGSLLCLGDSITVCRGESGTWRYLLWKDLVAGGYTFDFIGTQGRGDCPRSATPDFMDRKFDADNEGHGGWSTDDLLNGRDEPDNNLAHWLEGYTPDTVLLQIGGNDLHLAEAQPWVIVGLVTKMHDNLRKIIHLLQADNPGVTIYLALHEKVNGDKIAFANGGIALYNAGIPNVARETTTSQSKVILVDLNTGWTNDMIEEDGVHPNPLGNTVIAHRWFKTIHEGPQEITLLPPIVGGAP